MKKINYKRNEIRKQRQLKQEDKNRMFDYYSQVYDKYEYNFEPQFTYDDYNSKYIAIDSCKQGTLIVSSLDHYKNSKEHYENLFNISNSDMGYVEVLKGFIPDESLHELYEQNRNKDNDWYNVFKKEYKKQLLNSEQAQLDILKAKELLDNGENVCLLCYCKGYKRCHRNILAKLFKKFGYEVIWR